MREFIIGASSLHATYSAGRFVAASRQDAIRQAREAYARSSLGRQLGDVNAFRFYVESSTRVEEQQWA